MAKASADVNNPNEKQGGFATDGGEITGFSHMHDSGTGGVGHIKDEKHHELTPVQSPSLGNFPIFPQVGCPGGVLDNCLFTKADRASQWINSSVEAHPGYFAVTLNTSIKAEMTVTNHTALYRLTFLPNSTTCANQTAFPYNPLILVDLTDLPESRINGTIEVNETTGRITGNGTFSPSFGLGSYDLHFCADFSGAAVNDTGVFMNNRAGSQPKSLKAVPDGNTPQFLLERGLNSKPLPITRLWSEWGCHSSVWIKLAIMLKPRFQISISILSYRPPRRFGEKS